MLVKTGGFGRFQKTVMVSALVLSGLHTALYAFGHYLILVTPLSQWCFHNDSLPSAEEISVLPRGKCQGVVVHSGGEGHPNGTFQQGLKACPSGWQYDTSEFFPTVTMENEWVCGDSWKVFIVHTTFWLGSMAGYLICGVLSDRIGRKKTIMLLTVIGSSANVAGTIFSGIVGFSILRFFTGIGALTVNSVVFILAIEYTVSERRTLVAFVWVSSWGLLSSVAPWYGYLTQSWRSLLYAAVVADALLLFCLAWIPESSSWLLSVGRTSEAVDLLQRLASSNGRSVTTEAIAELLLVKDKQSSPKEVLSFCESTKAMLKLPRLRRMTLLTYATWFFVSLCYNGCTLELGRLGLNIYTTYSIAMAFELPVNIICIISLDVVGRRWPNVAFLLAGGASCITMALTRNASETWTLAMAALCLSAFAGCYMITYQLGSEIFPTVIRGRAVQLQRLVGELGGLAGMHVVALGERDRYLPVMVMGATAVAASVFAFFLPDTVHLALPQTLEDAEGLAGDRGLCFCPVSVADLPLKRRGGHSNGHCSTGTNGRATSAAAESTARTEDKVWSVPLDASLGSPRNC